MHNPVVTTLARAFAAQGWTSLRFNFRGVGNSEGDYDEGRGEVADLVAACDFLAVSGIRELVVAGYSFGAWVITRAVAAGHLLAEPLLLVSPPLAMLPSPSGLTLPNLALVVTGQFDEIAPPGLVGEQVSRWNPGAAFTVLEKCDHFYGGRLEALTDRINQWLAARNGKRV